MSLEDDRDPVEILAEDFLQKHRDGNAVSVEEYATRYPDLAEDIVAVFPAMLAMEKAKPTNVVAPQLESFDAIAHGKIKRLGDFRIVRKIAHGGMGVVYEAEEISLDRKVAIKVLATHLITDQSALKRFQREAKTIARLHHTNIVSVFGAGVENDLYFFVMEFIDGKSLDRLIQSGEFEKRFLGNWDWIAEAAKRIALALRHAHQKSVLHRDVKPGNILIDADCKPWITDFGLAKFDDYDDLTRPGDAVGTLRYMAPEQMKGETDPRTDVYGLGLVLYEMLVGGKVYEEDETHNLLERIRNQDLPIPSKLNSQIPLDLERITLKAIATDPDDRYQQALDFADDLDRWQNDLPIRARKLTTFETLSRWTKRNPLIAGLTGVVTCLMLILLISLGSLGFAWLGEHSAKLDAEIAQRMADEARQDAENSAKMAITVLDQLTSDLGMFNQIGGMETTNQSLLFSPMGGIPVSRKTEAQLDLVLDFYQSIGNWSDQRDEIKYRRVLANIRSGEISLHLRKYDQAREDLNKVVEELRGVTDTKLVRLHLYANYLMGFANLLARDYQQAAKNFQTQDVLINSLDWDSSELRIEKGKLQLGKGILAHFIGDIQQWHGSVRSAIKELEVVVDELNPSANPVAAVFLARCYLNLPPRFQEPGYRDYYLECRRKAVAVLYRLNQWQVEQLQGGVNTAKLVFFFDLCEAVSTLPAEVEAVILADDNQKPVTELLRETISACREIVESNADVPAYRFALARCQFNLSKRVHAEFNLLTESAINNLSMLIEDNPRDPTFLTERGEMRYRVGLFHLARRDLETAKLAFQLAITDLNRSLESSSIYPKTQVFMPQVHENLAIVFDQLDDPKKAAYHRSQQSMLEKTFPQPGRRQR